MKPYEKLNRELREAGISDQKFLDKKITPVATLVNTKKSSKPYVDILLKYLPELKGNEKEMVVRALSEKGNKKAVPYLIDIMKDPNGMRELNLWAVGNALRVINDKSSYNVIIDLCKNKTLGISRQMMLVLLSRSKTEEAFQTLIECLKEPKLKGHAIEALGKFGDKRAIDIIRNTDVEKGKYEFKAKQTALKRLQKK